MSEELNNQNSVEPQVEAPANVPTTESAPQAETQSAAPVEQTSTEFPPRNPLPSRRSSCSRKEASPTT